MSERREEVRERKGRIKRGEKNMNFRYFLILTHSFLVLLHMCAHAYIHALI